MWTAIVLTGAEHSSLRRVYVGAIHTIVYSAMHRTVATSHNLMPTLRRHDVISRAFDPLEHNAPFTLGLTAFEGLSRLLPNHYLDLDSFAPVRHWPRLAMPPLDRVEDGAARVVEHSRRMVRVVGERHGTVRIFLSAGRDSRAVLALARPLLAEGVTISLATSVKPDFNALIDWHAARRLARIAKLPLEVRWRRRHVNDATAVMREFVRLGESKSGPILSSPDLRKRQPTTRGYTLSGMAGETARAVFWKRDTPNGELSPELLVKWIGSPSVSPVVEAAARWLDALPREMRGNSIDVLDLAYVENRLACLESTTRYLFPGRPQVMSPMAAAFNIETMLRLPGPYRQAGQLQRDMVARGWPELLAVPFNTPFGVLRAVRTAERAVHATRGRLGAMRRRWP